MADDDERPISRRGPQWARSQRGFTKPLRLHGATRSVAVSAACLLATCALWYAALLVVASFLGYDLQP